MVGFAGTMGLRSLPPGAFVLCLPAAPQDFLPQSRARGLVLRKALATSQRVAWVLVS